MVHSAESMAVGYMTPKHCGKPTTMMLRQRKPVQQSRGQKLLKRKREGEALSMYGTVASW